MEAVRAAQRDDPDQGRRGSPDRSAREPPRPRRQRPARRYTLLETPASSLESMMEVMRSDDWRSFRQALRSYASPPLHAIYADVEGNIGYQTATLVAARSGDRLLPRIGWTGEDEWSMVPFEDLPSMFNPRASFIFTANHLAAGSWYPYRVGAGRGELSEDPGRKLSVRDFVTRIHQDAVNPILRDAVVLTRKIVDEDRDADPEIRAALEALRGWDFRLSTRAPAYPVARAVLEAIESRKLAGTPLEARFGDGWGGVCVLFKEVMPRFRTSGETPVDPEVRRWLKEALREGFRKRGYGSPEGETTGWMRAQTPPGAGSSVESSDARAGIVRRLPYQDVPEGYGAERFGSFAREYDLDSPPLRSPLTQTIWAQEGNSYSQIVDLADFDRSLSMLPPGISEDPASPHFKDQMDLWAEANTIPRRSAARGSKRSGNRRAGCPVRGSRRRR
ncbi:MAG: hypothetical protein DMG07_28305 [Acidobacteria bacterium]|nr:MAG: hypothetical protein DMG07_28305 [Acidobacteriota bacterium]